VKYWSGTEVPDGVYRRRGLFHMTFPTRREFLSAAAVAAMIVAAPVSSGSAERPQAANLGKSEQATLAQIETYLNNVTTMRARFLQASSSGETAQGSVSISRPGRMRIEYDPPLPVLIIADGTLLIYYDKDLAQVTHVPLSSTPAGILLEERISLQGGDLTVTDFESARNAIRVTLTRTENPGEGKLALIFSESPLRLREWTVTDAQGVVTNVALVDAEFGVSLDPDLFRFRDPRIFDKKFPE
jgi:outer membrane lipoprotein-sorting protein